MNIFKQVFDLTLSLKQLFSPSTTKILIKNIYSNTFKEKNRQKIGIWQIFNHLILCIISLRCTIISYKLHQCARSGQCFQTYLKHDALMYIFSRIIMFNSYIGICAIPIPVFAALLDWLVYVRQSKCLWTFSYEILIENCQDFWLLNRQHLFSFDRFNLQQSLKFSLIRQYIQTIKYVWNFENAKFYSRLPMMPNVSTNIRCRVVILSFLIEKIEAAFLIFYGKDCRVASGNLPGIPIWY